MDLSLGSEAPAAIRNRTTTPGALLWNSWGPLGEWGLYHSNRSVLFLSLLNILFFSTGHEVFLSLGIQALTCLIGVLTD